MKNRFRLYFRKEIYYCEDAETGQQKSLQIVVCALRQERQWKSETRKLVAACGPLDLDDARPAITVMMPDED